MYYAWESKTMNVVVGWDINSHPQKTSCYYSAQSASAPEQSMRHWTIMWRQSLLCRGSGTPTKYTRPVRCTMANWPKLHALCVDGPVSHRTGLMAHFSRGTGKCSLGAWSGAPLHRPGAHDTLTLSNLCFSNWFSLQTSCGLFSDT